MKIALASVCLLVGLSGCISSSSAPPPDKTTVVVPASNEATVICPDGSSSCK